jgi:hypothetical protein
MLSADQIGDITTAGEFPPKVVKALNVVADLLHPAFDRLPWIREPGWSKQSCVLASLACRDFLVDIGFRDAKVRPCAVVMRAKRAGKDYWLGIGDLPGQKPPPADRWNGHLVVTVPSERLLLDTTLYQARRPHWPMITGMMAAELRPVDGIEPFGKRAFAMAGFEDGDDFQLGIFWLDDPDNTTWLRGPDCLKRRRRAVVAALRDRFGDPSAK